MVDIVATMATGAMPPPPLRAHAAVVALPGACRAPLVVKDELRTLTCPHCSISPSTCSFSLSPPLLSSPPS